MTLEWADDATTYEDPEGGPPEPPCSRCPEYELEVHPGNTMQGTEYDTICNAGIGDLFNDFMQGCYTETCPYLEVLEKYDALDLQLREADEEAAAKDRELFALRSIYRELTGKKWTWPDA